MTEEPTPLEYERLPRRRRSMADWKPRRSWTPVINDLLEGRTLFLRRQDLPPGSLKYLRLAVSGRNAERGGERYRIVVRESSNNGHPGYILWTEPMETVQIVMEGEEVSA